MFLIFFFFLQYLSAEKDLKKKKDPCTARLVCLIISTTAVPRPDPCLAAAGTRCGFISMKRSICLLLKYSIRMCGFHW